MTILVACGLKREAKALSGPGIQVIAGGGQSTLLAERLSAAAGPETRVLFSCGIAGALDPMLETGDVIIDGDAEWVAFIRELLPDAMRGAIIGRDTMAASVSDKSALAAETGAVAVDMESHIARKVAARHGLPFAAIRVISDGALDDLPPAALVGMRPDGGMAIVPVLWSLIKQPGQLPSLIRTGRQAGQAFAALDRIGKALEELAARD